ncbi:hypothetical protein BH09MYX1_BH09MYX1_59500 [soil metagenome]
MIVLIVGAFVLGIALLWGLAHLLATEPTHRRLAADCASATSLRGSPREPPPDALRARNCAS